MAGALNYNRYPLFDMSEIIQELEFGMTRKKVLNPLRKGEQVPNFSFEKSNFRWQQFVNGVEKATTINLLQLLNKPLIIAFYSAEWQAHSLNLLLQLNRLNQDIKAANANILIVSAEKEKGLENIVWENSLSLNFYYDTERLIAEKFGIYSDDDPVWDKFSGIDTNVPLLATYAISAEGEILFDYVEWDFSKDIPAETLLASVNGSRNFL